MLIIADVCTECRWLIVYDNVESLDLLLKYWPTASRGQALIITRNHSFASKPADGGLEIKTWDAETGSRVLLLLLATDFSVQLTDEEANSAHELLQKLSGHAQRPGKLYGMSGNSLIIALWNIAYKSLDPQSCAILGVLCFVAPDSVPQAVFEPESAASLPNSLAFCSDCLW